MKRLLAAAVLAIAFAIPVFAADGDCGTVPGMSAVPADAALWCEHLQGDTSMVGSPDPAQLLAQWLELERVGIVGTSLTDWDLRIGLASARAYATQRGVSASELVAAQKLVLEKGGLVGTVTYDPLVARAYQLKWAGIEPAWDGYRYTVPPVPSNAAAYVAVVTDPELAAALVRNWGLAPPVAATPNAYAVSIARLRVSIARLIRSGRDPIKLALYQARLIDYLAR
jgi:hypothetical protein